MSDIDFDELDRAVASVLSTGPGTAAGGQPAAAPQPAPVASPLAPAPEPVATRPVTSVSPAVAPNPAASAQDLHSQPVKPVQRGRFLDMVHPSGDMAPRSAPAVIRPVQPSSNAAFVSDIVAPAPAATPAAVAVATPQPDPIPATTPVSPPASEAPAAPVESNDFFAASPDDASPHKAPEIPASPFIPDAKVEKRPLGSISGNDRTGTGDLYNRLIQVESEDNVTDNVEPAAVAAPSVIAAAPQEAAKAPEKQKKIKEKKVKVPKVKPSKDSDTVTKRPPKYGSGNLIWITVAVAVMLIGFGVGATLYFVVLQ